MSEENKTVELKEEELEQVSGGCEYNNPPDDWFDTNVIVEDPVGVRLQILGFNSTETANGEVYKWFDALVIHVPETAMSLTSWREGEVHFVNSSFVHKV